MNQEHADYMLTSLTRRAEIHVNGLAHAGLKVKSATDPEDTKTWADSFTVDALIEAIGSYNVYVRVKSVIEKRAAEGETSLEILRYVKKLAIRQLGSLYAVRSSSYSQVFISQVEAEAWSCILNDLELEGDLD